MVLTRRILTVPLLTPLRPFLIIRPLMRIIGWKLITRGRKMGKIRNRWHWFAGGCVILIFMLLLAVRLVGLPRPFSGAPETLSRQQGVIPIGEFWMNITQAGRKIGYAQRSYSRTEGGFRFSENIFMRISTMGVEQPLTVRTAAELKPDRTLASFQFDLGSNLFKFTARGVVEGRKLTVRIGGPAEEKVSVIDLAEPPYLGGGILESAGAGGLKPGEGRTFRWGRGRSGLPFSAKKS
jgi:hypothetical protein